jgi:hypothetical protein
MYITESTTTNKALTGAQLLNLEVPLASLAAKVDSNGDALFAISVAQDADDTLLATPGSADVARWVGNHVSVDMAETDPTTPCIVSAWRINQAAGECYVGGQHFVAGAAADETGDGDYDRDGAVFAGPMGTAEDVYAYVLLVNNAGTLERIFVFGTAAGTGLAVDDVTDAELAAVVGTHLSLSGPSYNFAKVCTLLFEESTGLSQTTTSVRTVPGSY